MASEAATVVVPMAPTPWRRAWRHGSFAFGAVLTLLLVGAAVLGLLWTPYDVTQVHIVDKLQGPSTAHWLGTDHFGRDVVSLLLVGAQNSIVVGVVAVGIGVVFGVALGLLAAAPGRGGWTEAWADELLMRFSDLVFAFPAVLSAIMITALLGPGAVNSILAIGIFNVPVFARLARGAAKQVWTREFILAARAAGKGRTRITLEHVLPNIASLLIVQATIQFALAILAEAALSYLGLGTQPPHPSWGRMLNDAQSFLFHAPMLAIYPGVAIALSVLGLNLLGDGLRDLLDPKLTRSR
jgi:peptide/nickel transport system permease protein